MSTLLTNTTATDVNSIDTSKIYSTKLCFNINGEDIIFEGNEIKYLKEMLQEYIKEKYPEELL